MSIPSLLPIGSFPAPYDREEPNHTTVYSIECYKSLDGIETYSGCVGAGSIENNVPKFLTSVPIAFTWNPATKEAIVKLGNFAWIGNPQEYAVIPKNLNDCRFNSKDSEDSIMCFTQKRYDYTVSVSRAMNAILQAHNDCYIRVEKFTDEERKEYDAYEAGRPQRNYLRAFNAIAWPTDMENPESRMNWLKAHDPETYEDMKSRREHIESQAMMNYRGSHPTPDGTYFVCLDEVVQGPFATEDEMEKALFYTIPMNYPACPYKMKFEEGMGREM